MDIYFHTYAPLYNREITTLNVSLMGRANIFALLEVTLKTGRVYVFLFLFWWYFLVSPKPRFKVVKRLAVSSIGLKQKKTARKIAKKEITVARGIKWFPL